MATVTLANGLAGGFVATVVMTAFMLGLGDDSPPPTALFWSKYVGSGPPEESLMPGMVLHLLYGTVAGAVLAVVLPAVGFTAVAVALGVGLGAVYGVVLFLGAAVFWMNVVLGLDPEPAQIGGFLLFHLIYGVVLGAWLGVGVL